MDGTILAIPYTTVNRMRMRVVSLPDGDGVRMMAEDRVRNVAQWAAVENTVIGVTKTRRGKLDIGPARAVDSSVKGCRRVYKVGVVSTRTALNGSEFMHLNDKLAAEGTQRLVNAAGGGAMTGIEHTAH